MTVSSCVACPPVTYYNTTIFDCNSCNTNCTACTSATVCTACINGTYLIGSLCGTCPSATYYSIPNLSCPSCSVNCITCTSQTVCTACENGFSLINSSCVGNSQNSSFPTNTKNLTNSTNSTNSTTNTSLNVCPQNCQACSLLSCDLCEANYHLTAFFQCVNCPTSTYFDFGTNSCESCP